ncbi:MAG: carboxypeptidase regulatory-like domain-containing protein, partial [Bryobacteraceae bacterium]
MKGPAAVCVSLLPWFVLLTPRDAAGQAVSGTIAGYVYDSSSAVIANAQVTAVNVETGVSTVRTSDSTGRYVVTNLVPGTYSVRVEAAGFRRFVQDNIVLRVDSVVRVDPQLELGAVTEQVVVSAAPPMLNSEKTDVGQYIPQKQLQELPTFGRNLSKLYNTVPGVIQNSFQIGAGENPSEFNGTVVNGQFFGNSEYEIDGITDTACCFSGFQVIVPNQDSVQEVKITTAAYDPEFGSSAGLVAQYVTKSGTNELHGSAFAFNRNKFSFAADPFTEKLPNTGDGGKGFGPAPFNWNQFGGSLGGPLKRNKMFWFGDFQATLARQGGQRTATVPNDAFRLGDFSALARNPIFDPLTGTATGAGRQQFAGNRIPANRINPVARNLLELLPRANLSQATDVNFVGGGTVKQDSKQGDVRFDYNISDSDKLFVRYTLFTSQLDNPPVFGKVAGGLAVGSLS